MSINLKRNRRTAGRALGFIIIGLLAAYFMRRRRKNNSWNQMFIFMGHVIAHRLHSFAGNVIGALAVLIFLGAIAFVGYYLYWGHTLFLKTWFPRFIRKFIRKHFFYDGKVRITRNGMGRFIIVRADDWHQGWTGSEWTKIDPYGFPPGPWPAIPHPIQVSNFKTLKQAIEYAESSGFVVIRPQVKVQKDRYDRYIVVKTEDWTQAWDGRSWIGLDSCGIHGSEISNFDTVEKAVEYAESFGFVVAADSPKDRPPYSIHE